VPVVVPIGVQGIGIAVEVVGIEATDQHVRSEPAEEIVVAGLPIKRVIIAIADSQSLPPRRDPIASLVGRDEVVVEPPAQIVIALPRRRGCRGRCRREPAPGPLAAGERPCPQGGGRGRPREEREPAAAIADQGVVTGATEDGGGERIGHEVALIGVVRLVAEGVVAPWT